MKQVKLRKDVKAILRRVVYPCGKKPLGMCILITKVWKILVLEAIAIAVMRI